MTYNQLATQISLDTTVTQLQAKGYSVVTAATSTEALDKIKEIIPSGASVMNGASVTLEQIGFVDYLKSGLHGWDNLHASIVAATDPAKQAQLRQEAVHSDYYLGSVHGLAETGDFVIASNSGSQLPHVVFTSPNLIFVVSTKKIVPTLVDALSRLEDYVVPLEDVHMQQKYGAPGTQVNKIVIFKGENPMVGRKVTFILIQEDLGF